MTKSYILNYRKDHRKSGSKQGSRYSHYRTYDSFDALIEDAKKALELFNTIQITTVELKK